MMVFIRSGTLKVTNKLIKHNFSSLDKKKLEGMQKFLSAVHILISQRINTY